MAADLHLASPGAGRRDPMPRVKIGPALPDYRKLEVEIAACAISTTAVSGDAGMP
jgi:hypothetical protein